MREDDSLLFNTGDNDDSDDDVRDLAPDPEPRKRPLSSSIRSFGNGSGGVVMSKRDKVNYLVGKGRKELDEGDIVTDELRWEGFTKYFFPS